MANILWISFMCRKCHTHTRITNLQCCYDIATGACYRPIRPNVA